MPWNLSHSLICARFARNAMQSTASSITRSHLIQLASTLPRPSLSRCGNCDDAGAIVTVVACSSCANDPVRTKQPPFSRCSTVLNGCVYQKYQGFGGKYYEFVFIFVLFFSTPQALCTLSGFVRGLEFRWIACHRSASMQGQIFTDVANRREVSVVFAAGSVCESGLCDVTVVVFLDVVRRARPYPIHNITKRKSVFFPVFERSLANLSEWIIFHWQSESLAAEENWVLTERSGRAPG